MATCEIQWLLYLLSDLGVTQSRPVELFCDNKSAIYKVENPVFHERTKHIEIDCHVVRDKYQQGVVIPMSIKTEHQLADVFTKVDSITLQNLTSDMGVCNVFSTSGLRGVLKDQLA